MENDHEIIRQLLQDKAARVRAVRMSHALFCAVYLNHYITVESPPFHKEIYRITQDSSIPIAVILAFRGSGKSTLISLAHVLWAIMGVQQVKFVLLVGLTQEQSRQMLRNIRSEIESNPVLAADLGPFRDEEDELRNSSIVLSNFGAKIMAVSVGQSVRGFKHGPHRPGLIICDDIEDLESARTREGREKTRKWVTGELLPTGETNTRTIIVGNLLHRDALIPRLKTDIESGAIKGVYREFPLVDANGFYLWPAMYPTSESIEALLQRIGGDRIAFSREYLLRFIDDSERIVQLGWIRYWEQQPSDETLSEVVIGIDLAISKNENACKTAMIVAKVHTENSKKQIYIQPHPVNDRLSHLETLETAKHLADIYGVHRKARIVVEDVGYQRAVVESLEADGYRAEGFPVRNQDKAARLRLVTHLIESGRVLFPKQGCEDLIRQLVDFGIEADKDLADAFSILLLAISERTFGGFYGAIVDGSDDDDD
jgi:phage terminase large subunit-like protein